MNFFASSKRVRLGVLLFEKNLLQWPLVFTWNVLFLFVHGKYAQHLNPKFYENSSLKLPFPQLSNTTLLFLKTYDWTRPSFFFRKAISALFVLTFKMENTLSFTKPAKFKQFYKEILCFAFQIKVGLVLGYGELLEVTHLVTFKNEKLMTRHQKCDSCFLKKSKMRILTTQEKNFSDEKYGVSETKRIVSQLRKNFWWVQAFLTNKWHRTCSNLCWFSRKKINVLAFSQFGIGTTFSGYTLRSKRLCTEIMQVGWTKLYFPFWVEFNRTFSKNKSAKRTHVIAFNIWGKTNFSDKFS